MDTKNLFSVQSKLYSVARPTYPEDLFRYLASLTGEHELAWDVGTGNGQTAVSLSLHYKHVVATDVSKPQLDAAATSQNITFLHLPAELSDEQCSSHPQFFSPGLVDIVTISQALHWFNFPEFYRVVHRVLKPRTGVIAAWIYGLPCINDEINAAFHKFYSSLGNFWLPNRALVEHLYETIPFTFEEVDVPVHYGVTLSGESQSEADAIAELRKHCSTHPNMNYMLPPQPEPKTWPKFFMWYEWTLTDLLNYAETWSSVQLANKHYNRNVMEDCRQIVQPAWYAAAARLGAAPSDYETTRLSVVFPIYPKCGRVVPK